MNLYFARHAESQANVQGIISNRDLPHGLTELGRTQAQALAEEIQECGLAAVYSSPIPRARQTAGIVAAHLGIPCHAADALREIDCGAIEGRGDAEAWRIHDECVRAWDELQDRGSCIPGGESLHEVEQRFIPFVEGLINPDRAAGGNLLLISHGNTLRYMLPGLLSGLPAWQNLGNCHYIQTELKDGGLHYAGRSGVPG